MVEKATKDLSVAEKQMAVAEAEVRAAQTQVRTPQNQVALSDGVIRNVKKHIGEWAQQGDPIFNVVRMDRLRVQGSLKADQCSPEEVIGKTVIVEAVAERGRKITAQGKIVYVDPVLEGGSYAVRAEVENYQEKSGFWAIRPGNGCQCDRPVEIKRGSRQWSVDSGRFSKLPLVFGKTATPQAVWYCHQQFS